MQPCRIWDTQTQERGLVRDFVFDLGDEVHFSFKRATRQRCSISGRMDGWMDVRPRDRSGVQRRPDPSHEYE